MPSPNEAWPIFVIALEIAVERRIRMTAQLQAAGLEFTFIDAIDGRKALPPVWEAAVDRQGTIDLHGYGVTDGEYACALSHQLVYARILDQGLPGAVVLEDDAILTEEFAEFCRKGGYREADFIQMFCFSARIWRGPGRRVLDRIRLFRLEENCFGAVGYCLSAKAAARLRDAAKPLRGRADWPADLTRIGAMLTVPSIVLHLPPGQLQSYVHETHVNLIPEGFDFSAKYVKGWRRLITPSAWVRFVRRRLSHEIAPGFAVPAEVTVNRASQ